MDSSPFQNVIDNIYGMLPNWHVIKKCTLHPERVLFTCRCSCFQTPRIIDESTETEMYPASLIVRLHFWKAHAKFYESAVILLTGQ
ncbi:hypothetical protein [Alteribacillus sp. HJP-4]|uniref:hypothetical protein n=1 Tax=Alteribacillus sp. HJP-4 TaxID=2775394 RepID=UPI0035CCDEB3